MKAPPPTVSTLAARFAVLPRRDTVHALALVAAWGALFVLALSIADGIDPVLARFTAESEIGNLPFGAWSLSYLANCADLLVTLLIEHVVDSANRTATVVASLAAILAFASRPR